jgi:hypothetical protein
VQAIVASTAGAQIKRGPTGPRSDFILSPSYVVNTRAAYCFSIGTDAGVAGGSAAGAELAVASGGPDLR